MTYTKEERLKRQREYRLKNGNGCTRKYEKTKKGFLMRMYRNMKSRTNGVQWKKAHLYKGLPLIEKDAFYSFALAECEFHDLFHAWEESEYCRKLTPSIDRIDTSRGYELGNMRFLTHSENSRRGSIAGNAKRWSHPTDRSCLET